MGRGLSRPRRLQESRCAVGAISRVISPAPVSGCACGLQRSPTAEPHTPEVKKLADRMDQRTRQSVDGVGRRGGRRA